MVVGEFELRHLLLTVLLSRLLGQQGGQWPTQADIIQGVFFNWPSPISLPKRELPSRQSGHFLVTGFTETAAGIG